jgi:outer membrane protein W
MKKVFLSIALITAFGVANAQEGFSKGNTFLTGSLGISSENDKDADAKSNSTTFAVGVGHFLSDHIAVGINVGFGSAKTTESSLTTEETSAMTAGAFGRYYFSPKSKFSMFGHLGVNYASITDKTTNPDLKVTGMDIFAAPGFNYFVSKNLSLEAVIGRIGYSSVKADLTGAKGTTGFDFGIDLTNVTFGMNFRF